MHPQAGSPGRRRIPSTGHLPGEIKRRGAPVPGGGGAPGAVPARCPHAALDRGEVWGRDSIWLVPGAPRGGPQSSLELDFHAVKMGTITALPPGTRVGQGAEEAPPEPLL